MERSRSSPAELSTVTITRVSSPSLIPNYLNFSMYVFLEVAKYGTENALPYVERLRAFLVSAGLDSSLLSSLALLQSVRI